MAAPSFFSMRVIRCPACGARLPEHSSTPLVRCEYCDARVEIARQVAAPSQPHMPGRQPHVARPQYSSFAWMLMIVPVVVITTGAFTAYRLSLLAGSGAAPASTGEVHLPPPRRTLTTGDGTPSVAAPTPTVAAPVPPIAPPTSSTRQPAPARGSSEPKAPAGPVIDVESARKQLEPKIRACMQTAKVHHVLAYMGNTKLGPVAVLPDSRTRVDGNKVALGKSALGRCIDAAGKSVRTSALRSNYVRLDVRNDGVPDPLGALPSKPNPSKLRTTIAGFDTQVNACARKHGAEGIHATFQFEIDGPTGKLLSLRAADLPKPLLDCASAIYRRASFEKVQEGTYQASYSLSL